MILFVCKIFISLKQSHRTFNAGFTLEPLDLDWLVNLLELAVAFIVAEKTAPCLL
jgi:hypothetical protein